MSLLKEPHRSMSALKYTSLAKHQEFSVPPIREAGQLKDFNRQNRLALPSKSFTRSDDLLLLVPANPKHQLVLAGLESSRLDERLYKLPGNENLRIILSDLLRLCQDSIEYDDDFRMPTPYSVEVMRQLLIDACKYVIDLFPLGTVYPDGDGGLRLEWIREECELRLIVPAKPTGRCYLYHETETEYGSDTNPSPRSVASRLNWLNQSWLTLPRQSHQVAYLTNASSTAQL